MNETLVAQDYRQLVEQFGSPLLLLDKAAVRKQYRALAAALPDATERLQRLGQPAEVAKAIYYLCTDQSSYVTGAELMINGGQHV